MKSRPPSVPGGPDPGPPMRPRRSDRLSVDQSSSLRSQHWYEIEVRVRDVSSCGFMARCAAPVQIGSYVSLDVPGIGPVQAQVRWQLGLSMGGMFLEPISLARCAWMAVRSDPPVAA